MKILSGEIFFMSLVVIIFMTFSRNQAHVDDENILSLMLKKFWQDPSFHSRLLSLYKIINTVPVHHQFNHDLTVTMQDAY